MCLQMAAHSTHPESGRLPSPLRLGPFASVLFTDRRQLIGCMAQNGMNIIFFWLFQAEFHKR